MSCNKDTCKCMFPASNIWHAIKLPTELIQNFKHLDVFYDGKLLTPSFIFGKKASSDYDLLDEFLIFNFQIKPNSIVNIRLYGDRFIYVRKDTGWEF